MQRAAAANRVRMFELQVGVLGETQPWFRSSRASSSAPEKQGAENQSRDETRMRVETRAETCSDRETRYPLDTREIRSRSAVSPSRRREPGAVRRERARRAVPYWKMTTFEVHTGV